MSIGKFVTSPAVLGAAVSAATTAKKTGTMRKDWRRYLVWGSWAVSFALAIASVAMQDRDEEFREELRAQKK